LSFDPNGVRDESGVHGPMVGCRLVNAPHQDPVILRLASAGRKQPQGPGLLYG
jgi:hypothetical protein